MVKSRSVNVKFCQNHFSRNDIKSHRRGAHNNLYKKFGALPKTVNKKKGYYFTVWAPGVTRVSVSGDFNRYRKTQHVLKEVHKGSGVYEGFIEGVKKGDRYHYILKSNKKTIQKIDPFAHYFTVSPEKDCRVWDLTYRWKDQNWMKRRKRTIGNQKPLSIYEIHLGSFKRNSDQSFLSYRELAKELPQYVKRLGFTHVEILPIMEHPFYGSWGYQPLGFFAPSSRYGSPQDFMHLVDVFHQHGLGVILDWVPAHFPKDGHGLAKFNGRELYEHTEFHPDWQTCIFNLGKHQVNDFLISSALFWLQKYHIDGIRVDAVASMLYLDYSRRKGEWAPNFYGGVENIDSVAFLRSLTQAIKEKHSDVLVIAEESTSWKGVSAELGQGGLGFDMKWNMGWMHDTLSFFALSQKKRDRYLNRLTFSLYYAFDENFVLPLSHDEVVHGKSSLLAKMPGKDDQKFAHLRCLLAYMYAHPGKKLLFMGSEIASWNEWNHDSSLDWNLLQYDRHQAIYHLIKDLNKVYKREKALHGWDCSVKGFEWIICNNTSKGIVAFLRRYKSKSDTVLVVFNYRDQLNKGLTVGVPSAGYWKNLLSTDDTNYDGSGVVVSQRRRAVNKKTNKQPFRIKIDMPSLSVCYFKKV